MHRHTHHDLHIILAEALAQHVQQAVHHLRAHHAAAVAVRDDHRQVVPCEPARWPWAGGLRHKGVDGQVTPKGVDGQVAPCEPARWPWAGGLRHKVWCGRAGCGKVVDGQVTPKGVVWMSWLH